MRLRFTACFAEILFMQSSPSVLGLLSFEIKGITIYIANWNVALSHVGLSHWYWNLFLINNCFEMNKKPHHAIAY